MASAADGNFAARRSDRRSAHLCQAMASEPPSPGIRGKVVDHISDGLLDCGLPVRAKTGVIGGSFVGVSNSPRIIDERAQAVIVECAGDIAGRSALRAVAGRKENDPR